MNELSLEDRQTRNNVSLPPIGHMLATAERGEDSRVARNGDYHAPPPTHALQYGQPPQQGTGYTQAFTPYRASHGQINNSVESVPSTAYSSPRIMANNHHFDTSSISSSSRESSVYSAAPSSSATLQAGPSSKSRSIRAKRGSESQGSGRRSKRPSTSMGSHHSGDEFYSWCDACDRPFDQCLSPKEHVRKSRKIDKEKAARGDMAEVLQKAEDLLELTFDLTCLKSQMPGNQKKSGLTWDKQQDMEAVLVVLNRLMSKLASVLGPEAYEEFTGSVNRTIIDRVAAKGGAERGSYKGDLLGSASGDESCPHDRRGQHCEFPIMCRKTRHARNYTNNMDRIRESHAATETPTPSPSASASAARTARANL